MPNGLLLRTDASSAIGTGHLMRCLAIAEAWRAQGGHAAFVASVASPSLRELLVDRAFDVRPPARTAGTPEDLSVTAEAARTVDAEWVALDGPAFGAGFQAALRAGGFRVLAVDDMGALDRYEADLVLNQNLHAEPDLYRNIASHTELLLGTEYVVLRREFLVRAPGRHEPGASVESMLVTLGGADARDHTRKVVGALERLARPPGEVTVVVGAGYTYYDSLEEQAEGSRLAFRVARNVSDMAQLMARTDLAISAGGTTVWELAFMGVPSLIGTVSPVEEALARGLRRHRLFVDLGPFELLEEEDITEAVERLARDVDERIDMSRRGRELVDGRGTSRLLARMAARTEVFRA